MTATWRTLFGPGVNPPDPATPGDDFNEASGTITIPAGRTTTSVSVDVIGDKNPGTDEWIVIHFGDLSGPARPGGYWGLGFAVIEDDDTPPGKDCKKDKGQGQGQGKGCGTK